MRNFNVARRQRFRIHAKTVVLRSDFDLIGQEIFHRMVRTVMAELQLERFAAERQATNLVAEANPENRNFADELADIFDSVLHRLGIAWTVRKKNAVGVPP